MLKEEYIYLDVEATTKQEVLDYIVVIASKYSISDSQEGLLEDLNKRELEFPTGLQDGFAIPHTRSKHVLKPSILFLRTKQGIEWGTMDDKKVNYLFVLLVPKENEGNLYLQMISKLATCLLEDDFKEFIKVSTNKQELRKYIVKNMEVR